MATPVRARLRAQAIRALDTALGHTTHSDHSLREAKRNLLFWLQARGAAASSRTTKVVGGSGLCFSANDYVELVPMDVPGAGAGQVTVRTDISAVNVGTERAQYLRLPNTSRADGTQPGGSLSGQVISVGSGVEDVRVGQRVAVMAGPHASVATVPAAQVLEIPEGCSPAEAALVRHGIIAAQGVTLGRIEPGVGFGMVGGGIIAAMAQRLAVAHGGRAEAVVAMSRAKEQVARAGGAESFLVVGQDDDDIAALELAVVFEVTGDPQALDLAVRMAAPGGRVVLLGSSRGITRAVPVDAIRDKELTLVGAHVDTLRRQAELEGQSGDPERQEAERYLALVADGRASFDDLITRTVDPREAPLLYREMVDDPSIVGAALDWSRLPDHERVRASHALRPPVLTGRGMEYDGPAARRPGRAGPAPDPFAGASGDVRVGMLGCGDISVHNAAGIAAAPNTRLVACFDPEPDLAHDIADAHGAQVAASAEALVAHPEVDVVFVAVPHHLHEPLATLAIDAGKHVVVEKPLSVDLASAARIVAAADAAGVTLSTCFPQRYDAPVRAGADLIARGLLGQLGGSAVRVMLDKSPSYWHGGYSGRAHSTWRESRAKAGGGVLIMNACHYVDIVRSLAGVEVDAVTAQAGNVDDDREVEDSIAVTLRYANGAIGSIVASSAVRGTSHTQVELWGRDGHLVLEPQARFYSLRPLEGALTARWQDVAPPSLVSSRAVYVSRLATALDQGRAPDVTARDGLEVQAIIEAAYRSGVDGTSTRPADLLAEVAA